MLFPELMFLETSAMTGENVEESFLKCSRVILNKIENGKKPNDSQTLCKYRHVVFVVLLFVLMDEYCSIYVHKQPTTIISFSFDVRVN